MAATDSIIRALYEDGWDSDDDQELWWPSHEPDNVYTFGDLLAIFEKKQTPALRSAASVFRRRGPRKPWHHAIWKITRHEDGITCRLGDDAATIYGEVSMDHLRVYIEPLRLWVAGRSVDVEGQDIDAVKDLAFRLLKGGAV